MICDNYLNGDHRINISRGKGKFKNLGKIKKEFCYGEGYKIQWADVNGDGNADMVCFNTGGDYWIQLNEGNGKAFTDLGLVLSDWCNKFEEMVHWADVNGDGKDDIICDDKQGYHSV